MTRPEYATFSRDHFWSRDTLRWWLRGSLALLILGLIPIAAAGPAAATVGATGFGAILPNSGGATSTVTCDDYPAGSTVTASSEAAFEADLAAKDPRIELAAGTYDHGGSQLAITYDVAIRNVPGDQVWFDGSIQLGSGFTTTTNSQGTVYQYSGTDYPAVGINSLDTADAHYSYTKYGDELSFSSTPTTGSPYGRTAYTRVPTLDAVTPGTDEFYVDHSTSPGTLYVGKQETTIYAASSAGALNITGVGSNSGDGSIVCGIGFRNYTGADSGSSSSDAAVLVNSANNVIVEDTVFSSNGVVGVKFQGDQSAYSGSSGCGTFTAFPGDSDALQTSTLDHNGANGLLGSWSDHLNVDSNWFLQNNFTYFDSHAVGAGAKVTSSQGVTVHNNSFDTNHGNGLWFDVSSWDAWVHENTADDNWRLGIDYEVSSGGPTTNNSCTSSGTVIENNDVENNGVGDTDPWGSTVCSTTAAVAFMCAGIQTYEASHVTIQGNELSGNQLNLKISEQCWEGNGGGTCNRYLNTASACTTGTSTPCDKRYKALIGGSSNRGFNFDTSNITIDNNTFDAPATGGWWLDVEGNENTTAQLFCVAKWTGQTQPPPSDVPVTMLSDTFNSPPSSKFARFALCPTGQDYIATGGATGTNYSTLSAFQTATDQE